MPIDPSFAELLSDPRNTVRPPPAHVPMDKVRQAADGAMAQGELPELHSITDTHVSLEDRDIPIRHYRPADKDALPAIVFCHGGGFVWGSIDTHDGICRRLAAQTGAAVISVGYRLAPKTRFPGPVEDVFGVLQEISRSADALAIDPEAIALCADSAGAAICVSVTALAARAGLQLRHLGLFYPALDPSCNSPSQHEFSEGPLLTKAAMEWFWSSYLGAYEGHSDIPLPHDIPDFSVLPQTTIVTAEFDPLRDEGADFFNRLKDAGVDARLTCHSGMIHGFLSLPTTSPRNEAAFQKVCTRLREALETKGKDAGRGVR